MVWKKSTLSTGLSEEISRGKRPRGTRVLKPEIIKIGLENGSPILFREGIGIREYVWEYSENELDQI